MVFARLSQTLSIQENEKLLKMSLCFPFLYVICDSFTDPNYFGIKDGVELSVFQVTIAYKNKLEEVMNEGLEEEELSKRVELLEVRGK